MRLPPRVNINDTAAFPPLGSDAEKTTEQDEAMDQDSMDDGHVHNFDMSKQPRAKDSWKCGLCKEERSKGQMRRMCTVDGCGKHACAQCCKGVMKC